MKKLTRKYKKNKSTRKNKFNTKSKSKSIKKYNGGMKRTSSSPKNINSSFIPINLISTGYLPRPNGRYDPHGRVLGMLEEGISPSFQKKDSSSNEYYDALEGSGDDVKKLFNKINFESSKMNLEKNYKKNFPWEKEKKSIEEMLNEKEEFRKLKSERKSSLRKTKHSKQKYSDNDGEPNEDPVLSLLFGNDPQKLKKVTKTFQKIATVEKYPTLSSITRRSK
jgi:hypothetical protein